MANFKMLNSGSRTYVVVLASGDSVMNELSTFARAQELRAASFTAIGAFSSATLAFFDVLAKQYQKIPVDDQTEVLSLVGDIVHDGSGGATVHAHAVLGQRDGTTRGGHLLDAVVRPTLEVMVTESPGSLSRRYDENSGLALIDTQEAARVEEPDPLRYGLAPQR